MKNWNRKLFIIFALIIILGGIIMLAFFTSKWASTDSNSGTQTQAEIFFHGDTITVSGAGVTVNGTTATILQGGEYTFSGELENGQIHVDAGNNNMVTLRLNDVQINNPTDDGIHIESAKEPTVFLMEGTSNQITCGTVGTAATKEASGAAIFSKENLNLSGTGKLVINGYINDGIKSKKNLSIQSGSYTVTAIADGIVATENLTVSDGTFDIDSQDDAFNADGNILISQGTFTLATGDDGIHADTALTIENGSIQITKSNEGLEANQIRVENGSIQIVSSDDGMNAYGGQNNMGGPGGSTKTTEETPSLQILGGSIKVDSGGDGLDSNGDLLVAGGEILVAGSTNSGNGALDIGTENGGSCQITGGTILAMGASGMAESFDETSSQCSFCYNHTETIPAGSSIEILDNKKNVIFSYETTKESSSIVFSSSELKKGEVYTLKINGESVEISQDTVSVTEGETGHGFGGRPDNGDHPGGGFDDGREGGREPGRKPDLDNGNRPVYTW